MNSTLAEARAKPRVSLFVRLTVACCLLYILSFFSRNSTAVIVPDLQQELGFTTANIGLISGSTMLAYGLMQLPAGLLTDAFGGRRVILALVGLIAVGSLGLALSQSPEMVIASRFLIGIGATIFVPCVTLLGTTLPAQQYSRAMGFLAASSGAGAILATTPMALFSSAFGWRGAELTVMFLAIAIMAMFYMVTRDLPTKPVATGTDGSGKAGFGSVLQGIAFIMRDKRFWPLCLWQMCTLGVLFTMLTLWWVPYLIDGAGLSRTQAATVLTGNAFVLLVAGPSMSWLSDTFFKSRKKPLVFCSFATLLLCLPWMLFPDSLTFGMHIIQAILLSYFTGAAGLLAQIMIKETFSPKVLGTAVGCVNFIYPVWSSILQVAFGLVLAFCLGHGLTSPAAYNAAFVLIIANLAVACICAFAVRETFSAG